MEGKECIKNLKEKEDVLCLLAFDYRNQMELSFKLVACAFLLPLVGYNVDDFEGMCTSFLLQEISQKLSLSS